MPPASPRPRALSPNGGEPTYKPGDQVRHPSFGNGVVIASRVDGSTEVIDVNFAGGVGVKKLDLAYAPLERM